MRGHFLIAALFPPESPLTLAVRLSCQTVEPKKEKKRSRRWRSKNQTKSTKNSTQVINTQRCCSVMVCVHDHEADQTVSSTQVSGSASSTDLHLSVPNLSLPEPSCPELSLETPDSPIDASQLQEDFCRLASAGESRNFFLSVKQQIS